VVGPRQDVGLGVVAADALHARAGRLGVQAHAPRQEHGAALVLQVDAVAVDAVGDALAVVVAPVPGDAQPLVGGGVAVGHQRRDGVARVVDHTHGDRVGPLEHERRLRALVAAVAVGREQRRDLRLAHVGRLALDALDDEEGGERGDDEQREDDHAQAARRARARHRGTSAPFGTGIVW